VLWRNRIILDIGAPAMPGGGMGGMDY